MAEENEMINDTVLLKTVESDPEQNLGLFQYRDVIFTDKNMSVYRESIVKGIELIEKSMSAVNKPFSGILPHELADKFSAIDLDQSHDQLADVLDEIEALYLDHAIYFHHPYYAAHLNRPVTVPAILAELLLSSINSSMDTWD